MIFVHVCESFKFGEYWGEYRGVNMHKVREGIKGELNRCGGGGGGGWGGGFRTQ